MEREFAVAEYAGEEVGGLAVSGGQMSVHAANYKQCWSLSRRMEHDQSRN